MSEAGGNALKQWHMNPHQTSNQSLLFVPQLQKYARKTRFEFKSFSATPLL